MKGDIPGYLGYKAAAKSSPEEILKGDKLGTQRSSGGQEQPRMEMKRDKLGRQGGSGSQEQPRSNIMKRDKLGKQGRSDRQYFLLRFTCSLAFAHPLGLKLVCFFRWVLSGFPRDATLQHIAASCFLLLFSLVRMC